MAVDLDYPSQKMFHPLPPSLGPGVYLGAVERATSFITDVLWYGIFAGTNPGNIVPNCGIKLCITWICGGHYYHFPSKRFFEFMELSLE